jgi:hypothetical protein
VAEGKHLGAELGVGPSADELEVSDEADELVRWDIAYRYMQALSLCCLATP